VALDDEAEADEDEDDDEGEGEGEDEDEDELDVEADPSLVLDAAGDFSLDFSFLVELELAPFVLERESVTYQPLPLKTMPTGWNTLRRLPPHCSHVVSGGSEKLWRFSIRSLQAVQV
jgi:hypothetical protein